MLLDVMHRYGARLQLETAIETVEKTDRGFVIRHSGGTVSAKSLVIATGGKSIPKMGATGFGYDVATRFGLRIVETRPGLVPLTFEPHLLERLKPLAGVAVDAVVSCKKTKFAEAMLFTHRGISGPSILQISSYWREGDEIVISMLPATDLFEALKAQRSKTVSRHCKRLYRSSFPRNSPSLSLRTFRRPILQIFRTPSCGGLQLRSITGM